MKPLALIAFVLSTAAGASTQAPVTFLPFNGIAVDAEGRARFGDQTLLFAIYAEPKGGVPLWAEVQTVSVDVDGRYLALLGSTTDGMPSTLFVAGETRWLGVQPEGGAEETRIPLTVEAGAAPEVVDPVEPAVPPATAPPPREDPARPAPPPAARPQPRGTVQVTESTFCLARVERECLSPIADGSEVSLTSLPVDDTGVPRIWFYSALRLTEGTVFVHAWDSGDRSSGPDRINPLDVAMVAGSASVRYRAFSYRNVPAPGLFRVVVAGGDGEPLPGAESISVRVVP
ncbi:MAG: hypothetical protein QGG24_04625 [Vicinamibacterales bacterium]|jgi:hypothetical protein|nr:hypothetical protein [Acidobacteriota bacterium]MDP7294585.1 hypothetical protein [Vicinamibacterales bacterium]MDP7472229.1 hypothetical protein [Vicinamibacterales bacterium]MDP7672051.1 hypothetical protein [Vicinamibacterales bacterium]HJO39194.1 hypothetical protein [Vicinamibacterales bacterium]|tara:strand:+ start:1934 stop:2794 length:861 start_codon:yes stop_codon:yes gene_type:complete